MASVRFDVIHPFDAPARVVWDELIDWKGHEAWIPATKVEIHTDGDPAAVGAEFTATTGYGPLALPDKMRVTRCDWDDASGNGDCEVEKLGPVLTGRAGFTVEPKSETTSEVVWLEDVEVRYLPRLFAPIAKVLGAAGFKFGMRKLAKKIAKS
ncbi:MAG: SRPBCC family protein [Actinomycetota bacterium]